MNIENSQLKADRDQLFADWGELITYQKIEQSFSPKTQQISESETELTFLTIVGNRPTGQLPDAGGQAQTVDLLLQVKAEEWTGSAGDITWRTIVAGTTYEVIEQTAAGDAHVVELTCRKVA